MTKDRSHDWKRVAKWQDYSQETGTVRDIIMVYDSLRRNDMLVWFGLFTDESKKKISEKIEDKQVVFDGKGLEDLNDKWHVHNIIQLNASRVFMSDLIFSYANAIAPNTPDTGRKK